MRKKYKMRYFKTLKIRIKTCWRLIREILIHNFRQENICGILKDRLQRNKNKNMKRKKNQISRV